VIAGTGRRNLIYATSINTSIYIYIRSNFHSFSISNFRCVLNVVFFLSDDSRASELYVSTFRTTLFHLHRLRDQEDFTRPMQMEQCSETSAHDIQTPGNHPKERIQQIFVHSV
jgi:hypothetical protein